MLQDLRYGLRMLLKYKGFTVVAILTVVLGVGVNVAMFSVLYTFILRALPYPDSNRLIRIHRTSPHSQSWPHSQGNFYDYRDQNQVFESMAAYIVKNPSLVESDKPAERLRSLAATSDFFRALGVQPLLGRVPNMVEYFVPEVPGASTVVVLNHSFWLSHFGGNANVIGQRIRLDGNSAEIIGVMPAGFDYPLLWGVIDLWTPLRFPPGQERARGNNSYFVFGRLKPGVSIQQAQQQMSVLAANSIAANLMPSGEGLRLEPLQRSVSGEVQRNRMWFLAGLAFFVLLIACGNLANLQLVRMAARTREYAIRAALGAHRIRLLRQTLTESLVLALAGGVLSLLLAIWAVEFMSNRIFTELPGARISFDFRVFGFALLLSVLTGLIFGAAPAWLSSRVDVNQSLTETSRSSSSSRSHNRLLNILIIGEVAFALVLLAGTGLFLRGLQRFLQLDPGWQVDGLVVAQVKTPAYPNEVQQRTFLDRLEQRISALPGVRHAALSWSLPLWSLNTSGTLLIEGRPEPDPAHFPEVFRETVSSDYFETLGIRLMEGRTFRESDKADSPPVTVINRAMARRFWPNESALGKHINCFYGWAEIVGVVNDIDFPANPDEPYTKLQSFLPIRQVPWTFSGFWSISLRGSIAAETIAKELRRAVAEIDRDLPVYDIHTARSLVDRAIGANSLLGIELEVLAGLGIVLAAIGIYGVTAYSVARRTGEIGIRMALGARREDVLRLVLRKGAQLSLIGTLLGVAGGYGIAPILDSLIPRLPNHDPLAIVFFAIAMFGVSLAACYLPARRATRIDPSVALRSE